MRIFFTTNVWWLTVCGGLLFLTKNIGAPLSTAYPVVPTSRTIMENQLPPPEQVQTPPLVQTKTIRKDGVSNSGDAKPTTKKYGEEKPGLHPGGIAGIVCGAFVVIGVVVVLIILFRRKLLNILGRNSEQKTNIVKNPERNVGENKYDEIQIQTRQENTVPTLPSTQNTPPEHLLYSSIDILSSASSNKVKDASPASNNSSKGADTTFYATIVKQGE